MAPRGANSRWSFTFSQEVFVLQCRPWPFLCCLFFYTVVGARTRGFGVSPFTGLAVHLVEVGEVHVHFLSLWCCPHGRPSSHSETRGGAVPHFDHLTETFQLVLPMERLNNFRLWLHKQDVRWLFTDNYSLYSVVVVVGGPKGKGQSSITWPRQSGTDFEKKKWVPSFKGKKTCCLHNQW